MIARPDPIPPTTLSGSPWDDEGCVKEHQRFMGEMFGAPNGVLIFDDTGFPKKGDKSAGVGRQYSGTLGKTDNCQVGVFMSYASVHGHTLVDRRLYIMSQWFEDAAELVLSSQDHPEGLSRHALPAEGHAYISW